VIILDCRLQIVEFKELPIQNWAVRWSQDADQNRNHCEKPVPILNLKSAIVWLSIEKNILPFSGVYEKIQ